jgi:hypothetical protein
MPHNNNASRGVIIHKILTDMKRYYWLYALLTTVLFCSCYNTKNHHTKNSNTNQVDTISTAKSLDTFSWEDAVEHTTIYVKNLILGNFSGHCKNEHLVHIELYPNTHDNNFLLPHTRIYANICDNQSVLYSDFACICLPKNLGDLDGDGRDEVGCIIQYVSVFCQYHIFSYSDGVWLERLSFPFHIDMIIDNQNLPIVRRHPTKKDKLIIKTYEWDEDKIYIPKDEIVELQPIPTKGR